MHEGGGKGGCVRVEGREVHEGGGKRGCMRVEGREGV